MFGVLWRWKGLGSDWGCEVEVIPGEVEGGFGCVRWEMNSGTGSGICGGLTGFDSG